MDANWTVETEVWSSGGPDLEHEVTGLDSGTQYDVQVRAVNGAGEGAWSATSVGTTRPGAPAIDSVTGVASGLHRRVERARHGRRRGGFVLRLAVHQD